MRNNKGLGGAIYLYSDLLANNFTIQNSVGLDNSALDGGFLYGKY